MRLPNKIAISLIRIYQATLSPQRGLLRLLYRTPLLALTPGVETGCRFSPTCSDYAQESFIRLPFFVALRRSLQRIRRCHNL